ncbi:MAG TPA: hypothetical protein VGN23_07065 [Verrucomicrobiae bacterium]|jgi:hypothetical protein
MDDGFRAVKKNTVAIREEEGREAVFLGFGVVSASAVAKGYGGTSSYRVFKHAPSPKPRQNLKNPRSERPHYFLKRSS